MTTLVDFTDATATIPDWRSSSSAASRVMSEDEAERARLHLDLGRDTVLRHLGDDPRQEVSEPTEPGNRLAPETRWSPSRTWQPAHHRSAGPIR